MFMLYAVPLGVATGLALGGQLRRLASARLRLAPLFVLALLVQVGLFSTPLGATEWAYLVGPLVYVCTLVLILAALLANLRCRGAWLVALGAGANLVVIAANGGKMPVLVEAVRQLKGEAALQALAAPGPLTNVALMSERTWLPFLGDLFALPRFVPNANVFSVGDILAALGLVLWITELMRAEPSDSE
ncbi:MAG: DUF5317 domain-containing protein [Chloroflexi bacterium]|nr:DUF5317 domain-containing protein [Chloroflexota bacterium]